MPKTRNVTRSQWDAANVSHTTTRNRNENVDEGEKENVGRPGTRATRSHTRSHGVLGASTATDLVLTKGSKILGERAAKTKAVSKGKGKPSTAPMKRKKLPLQDITDQFLPAPEAANRGEETQQANDGIISELHDNVNRVVATIPPSEAQNPFLPPPAKFTSPLPPSSPPSESTESPILEPQQSAPKFQDIFTLRSNGSIAQDPYDAWQEFDNNHAVSDDVLANASSHSDPFGFVSLERKLKVERETAAAVDPYDDEEILVADTSSPRPVRRLKRSLQGDAEHLDVADFAPYHLHPHYATPPTPHKDKQKRRRMSHEGHDIFSPCASSIESSPSPSKASAHKRPRPDTQDDPLGEFNEELDRSYEVEVALKKAKSSKPDELNAKDEQGSATVSRSLRSREKRRSPEENKDQVGTKRSKPTVKRKGSKKPVSKSRSTAAKKMEKAEASDQEEDLGEKWDRERQERLEYFKRLEDYHVEKEDVYLI